MGKGIAKEFKLKYPDMYKQYQKKCDRKEVKLGEPFIYTNLDGTKIINFPTKDHWKNNANYQDVNKGLDIFIKNFKTWGIKSIAFPPLGCGNGGLDWEYIGPLMYNKLKNLDIDVELYAPYGTKKDQLTEEFLSIPVNLEDIKRNLRKRVKPEWIVLLKVIENLKEKPYANPVGRTIFQKICFAAEQVYLADFHFKKGAYGPFSNEITPTLSALANNNIIYEKQIGRRMVSLRLGTEYNNFKNKYKDEIQKNQDKIEKITDLFQRIKNTDQAEEVATVLWIERELRHKDKNAIITDTDIIKEILAWKTKWGTDEKMKNIYNAIINLNMLNWTDIKIKNEKLIKFIKRSM